ncbi:hypothetical protein [Flavobacterium sp. GT3P67]|uniref:hypothetical protein n=1 Tax=Flavobacterium sp. GT3P67 TaxID=2541722 RepID=UPI00104AE59D|nr:hypothetical protein [Flavobacterium sp. GT3P67]TDE55051.1 hypothetical protein E0H99_01690 [Flavobacterium sp. GT3P67]
MKSKISQKKIWIISLISIFCFSSCEEIDSLNKDIDAAIDDMLGITALSEDLNKTSSNYNIITDIVINNKLVSSSETKMTLPTSVSVSYTKKRYTLTGSRWDIVTNSYSGTISKSMFNKTSNVVKIVVQNNTPSLSVNNVAVSIGSGTGGTGGTGGSGTTTGETKLIDVDVTGSAYQLKVVPFTVPSGVKSMTVKTNEPTNNYRNLADLFVRRGAAPIVAGPKPPTYLPKYTWTADYISHTPNREIKSCTILNPPSGTWYAGLYGFNSDFQSRLTVTITK